MKKNILHKQAFTFIELMVVITIMAILLLASYTPFEHYQTKQKVRNSAKIITQTLNDARNSAIYWISSSTWNLDIWVLFEENEKKIWIYGFPIKDSIWNYLNPDNKYLLENIFLEWGTQITSSGWLFLYKAITWSWIYKNFDIINNKIKLKIWMKWATAWPLTKEIEYYTKTYISDVK